MKRICIRSAQSLLTRTTASPASAISASRIAIYPSRIRHNSTQQTSSYSSSTPLPPYAAPSSTPSTPSQRLEDLPSPPVAASLSSAKLAALHARLSLPQRFPLQTLARALVDRTADADARFNNLQLSILGSDVLGYHMSEHLMCNFPRLPMDVLFAAQEAYVGPQALMTVAKEWGVEEAAEPGGEVDAGLLQFRYAPASSPEDAASGGERANADLAKSEGWRRGMSGRIVYDDQFGLEHVPEPGTGGRLPVTTSQDAHAHFVRALMGALHLHTGRASTKRFFTNHFLSRTLDLSKLFDFRYPTRDLSRLCLREGFERPVARLISETGRHSAHPVFVVGVYSGRDKLGEAVGGSLEEAKNRAAAAALKGWYLYSPGDGVTVPSEAEEGMSSGREWKANMIDPGEVIT